MCIRKLTSKKKKPKRHENIIAQELQCFLSLSVFFPIVEAFFLFLYIANLYL
jgi:hypothetical protein